MRSFLPNLLIFLSMCLCALVGFQWTRETKLQNEVQAFVDQLHEKLQTIQRLQGTAKDDELLIQRLRDSNGQLSTLVSSNDIKLDELGRRLEKATNALDRAEKALADYKAALQTANTNLLKQRDTIETLNQNYKQLAGERNLLVSHMNLMTVMINDLAGKWSQMGQAMQNASSLMHQREIAATNLNVMAGDFTAFAAKWNQQLPAAANH